MFKTIVIHTVGIGDWEYASEGKHCRSTLFRKDIEIPFVPYPGLILSGDEWLPGQLERVSFNVDAKHFICDTKEDYEIPDKISAMEDAGKSRDEITAWQIEKMDFKKDYYINICGWTLLDKRLEMHDRWMSTLRNTLD